MRKNVMSRRVLGCGLVAVMMAVMLLSALPFLSFAATVEVSTAQEFLTAVQEAQTATESTNISLISDVDLSDTAWETPDVPQGITVTGNGHLITGLKTTLFGTVSGTVTGIGVVLADSGVASDTSAILAKSVGGHVNNCFTYGTLSGYNGDEPVGGFVGSSTGAIDACFSMVSIDCISAPYVGGFIGRIDSNAASKVTHCYSAGDVRLRESDGVVAGFGNLTENSEATVESVYTSCQLLTVSSNAYPSGVNGLYDNQLSVVRENLTNQGLSTKALMTTTALSPEFFAVTSTAYPALQVFYSGGWGKAAQDIVRVSIAAAAFSDVDSSLRMEPPSDVFTARADYLTYNTYVDRTNNAYLSWKMDSDVCKLYDTVPVTGSGALANAAATGTGADLLRAQLLFSDDDPDAKLTVTSGAYTRDWFLSAYDHNPYFTGGNGTDTNDFTIANVAQLDHVRYYTLIDAANYTVVSDIANIGNFDPIRYFHGCFDGGGQTLSAAVLNTQRDATIGLFANSVSGSMIQNVHLRDVSLLLTAEESPTSSGKIVGALIGSADNTTVSNVTVSGTGTVLTGATVGGVIGSAENGTAINNVLVSVEAKGDTACGGIVGSIDGGSLSACGVTGIFRGVHNLGGLVGTMNGTTVSDSYSTAAVLSTYNGSEAADVGGLVGGNTGGTVSRCYAAGTIDAPGATTGVAVFVGSETATTDCYYDGYVTVVQDSAVKASSTTELTAAQMGDLWTTTDTLYPQLTYFSENTNATLQTLSALTTVPVRYQQYWVDAEAKDMTTGWLPKTYYASSGIFAMPIAVDTNGTKVYTVENTEGFGFEAASSVRLAVVRFEDASGIGVRFAIGVRKGLNALSYTVSGVADVNAYVELYYSTDQGATWQGSQVMSVSAATAEEFAAKVLYDIPQNSMIKVRVHMDDQYAVSSVKIGEAEFVYNENSDFYESKTVWDTNANIDIVIETSTPKWGLRKESY